MTGTGATVVILTRERPAELRRALTALRHQTHENFSVVVVGDRPSLADFDLPPELAGLAYRQCPEANVSRARNIALAASGDEIVAFCDDDAAPEPDWLSRLLAPFADETVGAVGGAVRGRNGVDLQWGAGWVTQAGEITAPAEAQALGAENRILNIVGVNCAYRAEALRQVGGFDESYHYFLDETDMNMRLVAAGWRLAFAAEAEVHHRFAASAIRGPNRAPRSLFQIGASKAYFIGRHLEREDRAAAVDEFRNVQRRRLTEMVMDGRLEPQAVAALMQSLEDGFVEGARRLDRAARGAPAQCAIEPAPVAAGPAPRATGPSVAVIARLRDRRRLSAAVRRLVESDCAVSLIEYRLTPRALRVEFSDGGYWRHLGGAFGGRRNGRKLLAGRADCARAELARVRARREFRVALRPASPVYAVGALPAEPIAGRLRGFVVEPLDPGARNLAVALARMLGASDPAPAGGDFPVAEAIFSAE